MVARRRSDLSLLPWSSNHHDVGLRERLTRCLAARCDDRFESGQQLAYELELCLDPEAKDLLAPRTGGWKKWVRTYPLFSVTMLTLIPNLVGAIFNFLYNHREVMDLIPDAEPTFMRIQTIINSVVFPVGILSANWLAGSVAAATRIEVRKVPRNESAKWRNPNKSQPPKPAAPTKLTSKELSRRRQYCLKLGHVAAAVGLVLWLIAAPIYPISLRLMVGPIPIELYLHFIASLVLCGAIAAAYPFFGVTFIAVRCFYPSMIQKDSMTNEDRMGLKRLMRQTWIYLILAACIPLISILILLLAEPDRHMALVVLSGGGLVGYAIAVTAFRFIQVDLTTLIRALWREDGSSTRSHH
jgi:hypothetical protein